MCAKKRLSKWVGVNFGTQAADKCPRVGAQFDQTLCFCGDVGFIKMLAIFVSYMTVMDSDDET